MKKILFALTLICLCKSSFAEENKIDFPAKPESLKACYQSGQDWINRQKWIVLASDKKMADQSYNFNKALSDCLWSTAEAKSFSWPESQAHVKKMDGLKLIAKNPAGDFFVTNIRFGDSLGAYLKISAKDGSVQNFTGPGLQNSYFYGFDFAAYDFGKNERAVGLQTAYLSKEAATISFMLTGGAAMQDNKPIDRNYLQSFKEIISKDQKTNNWVIKKYIYSIDPDEENVYPKITEKIRSKQATNLALLKEDKITKALPEQVKRYRWNGTKFTDEDISDWLKKSHAKKPVEPKMVKKKTEGKIYSLGSLKFKDVTEVEEPDNGSGGSSTVQWFEIVSGVSDAVKNKINNEVKKTALADSPGLMGPEPNPEDESKFLYGESSITNKVVSVQKNVMTILKYSSSQAPSARSYDDGSYISYNLETGEKVNWEKSFKTFLENKLFHFFLIAELKEKVDYVFPDMINSKAEATPITDFALIPKTDALYIIAEGNMGGHFFEEDLGKISYNVIPKNWIKPKSELAELIGLTTEVKSNEKQKPLLSPKFSCTEEGQGGPLENICRLKLVKSYEASLGEWQFLLEQQSSQQGYEKVISDYSKFTENISACHLNQDCVKKELSNKKE